MNKGVQLRKTIHDILFEIHYYNKTLDNILVKYNVYDHNTRDIAFIQNVCLNSMRYSFHINKIIKKFVKNKIKKNDKILFYSAITQLVYLNFKEYAVINCSVEVAKKLNIYPGFINATLKKISRNKIILSETKIEFNDLPDWFVNKCSHLTSVEKNNFLDTFNTEPDLHLVFKNNKYFTDFEENLVATSNLSGFLKEKKRVDTIKSYKKGNWWVQDFSSSFPLNNVEINLKKKNCLDMCAAPGGKSFQILSKNIEIVLNDKSKKRLEVLKNNLKRLNFKPIVINCDVKNISLKKKYDFIIIDAPCSALGTIRKNPDIFFKQNEPNFANLVKTQKDMLSKATSILNKKGIILYMVCSFLKEETSNQINNFLRNNKNFTLNNFFSYKKKLFYKNAIKDNFMLTLPTNFDGFNVDGYYAAFLKKNS